MSTHHDSQSAPADAHAPASPMSSADRARFWAGLNRFLEDEADSSGGGTPEAVPARVLRPPTYDHE